TAPLDVLLARDEIRTQRLQRSAARVERCRDFVIHSFYRSLTWPSDLIINASQQSVQQSYAMIVDFLKKS
ncbi:MAG TPA: hypothetical protein VHX42_00075, partial [Candidatus Babeliales bacterium]|nr:hypothetical protein [Candidatus Babeliales bacterium]